LDDSEAQNEPRLTKMDPSGSIFSSAKVEKWDRAEVKDLTDYLTVKESTTENTVKIWPSLLKRNIPLPKMGSSNLRST